jgi:glyceraldehyde-3-phosphate dehydrogenase (NAD(P)+) (phosphorylating)
MIKVGVNGYGTIGGRVADAVTKQKDMELVGVTKFTPDYRAKLAIDRGIQIYLADKEGAPRFEKAKIPIQGTLQDLMKKVDVMIEATGEEVASGNKDMYEKAGVRAVFEGGEEHELTGFSFNSNCNYDGAKGRRFVRVVSCNTTGLCRTLHALKTNFGVKKARAVLARRAADPQETGKGPIDAVVPDPVTLPSHHGPDVMTVLPDINITTMAIKIPTTHMHLHSLIVTLGRKTTPEEVIGAFQREQRIMLVEGKMGFKSTSHVIDWARWKGRPRNDVYEAAIWKESVTVVDDNELYLFLGVQQESIVVPENVDAIRAMMGTASHAESVRQTNSTLGIAEPMI